jgi:hypothetical protein
MSEVVQDTQPEFWRPPSPVLEKVVGTETVATMAEACRACGSEFLFGSRFCHTCGARRQQAISLSAQADAAEIAGIWERGVAGVQLVLEESVKVVRDIKFPAWLHYLHFHEIQRWIGLSTASLMAFIIGLACVAGALLVGFLTAKTFVDWQAIQFYRGEWLLAATASFVAGILLKRSSSDRDSGE